MAAKPARVAASTTGTRRALVLFARFKGEPANPVPTWATDLFNPDLPGSFAHFYDTMSFGKLQVRGEVAPQVYESAQPASAYLAGDSSAQGQFGLFAQEILRQADRDIDLSHFDNDGTDGVPNSGDDDGVVDAVFIVLERIPARFLLSEATGISQLGFDDSFITADVGTAGQALQVLPKQGTIEQGRSFAEAVGAMCHEYGHVLGLPDLYDTEFFRKPGAGPEEDSAGVGAWCLMGWGASGWNGNDGPNNFCAWSRVQLGWANVEEIAQPQEELHLGEVGKAGDLYKIPVDAKEYFLLEYRTRAGAYYDRHLPGEGLLIWHIAGLKGMVDLECADGQWRDAGYPLGKEPDPRSGSDNLDFWAHDEAYTRAHNGNLGDESDPFDGVRFADFAPQTNPNSYNLAGTRSVRVEGIHFGAGQAIAQVQTNPLRLEIGELRLRDPDGNGVLSPGEQATLYFQLANQGGLTVSGVRTVLSTADSVLHIERPEAHWGTVEIVPRARLLPGEEFPQVSLTADPKGNRQVKMALEVFAGETLITRHEFNLTIASTFKWSGRVRDEEGKDLPGIKIRIAGGNSYSVATDPDGAFQIDLVPGTYSASIPHPGHWSFSEGYDFVLLSDLHSELVLPAIYPVTGTVHGPQGKPLQVNINAYTPRYNGKYFAGFAFSEKDGVYTLMLAKGTYDIYVRSSSPDVPDRVLGNVHVDGPQTLDIDLQRGVRLSAQVVDEEEKGSVLALSMNRFPDRRASVSASLQTDSEGKGTVNVQPGMYLVRFVPPYFSHSPYIEMGSLFPVFADTTIQFRLNKGVEISGRVEDEGIEPFLNSRLIFVPQAPYSLFGVGIADDGTYTAQTPPGRCQVVFVGTDPGTSLQQRIGELSTQSNGTFDWTMPSGEPVVGKVVDGDGQAMSGIEVQALSVEAGVSSAVSVQADGTFSCYLQPGSYELTGVEHNASFFSLGTIDVPLTDTLRMQRPTGALLQGRVVDAQGHPIEQALVVLTGDARLLTKVYLPYLSAPQVYQSGGLAAAAISGEEGRYQLHAQAGRYELQVFPEVNAGVGRLIREVVLDGKREQDLVLPTPERVYQVYGQIHEAADRPGGKLVLQFFDAQADVVAQVTDLGYRGYGAELPAGHYEVRAGRLGPVGGFQQVYEVGSVSIDSDRRWDIALAGAATAVAEEAAARPQGFTLDLNYPNPFNPTTTICFSLPQREEAELAIYNLLGQRVATLVRGVQEAGPQVLQWNGRDDAGQELASGVYFYRLQAGAQVETRKLLLLR